MKSVSYLIENYIFRNTDLYYCRGKNTIVDANNSYSKYIIVKGDLDDYIIPIYINSDNVIYIRSTSQLANNINNNFTFFRIINTTKNEKYYINKYFILNENFEVLLFKSGREFIINPKVFVDKDFISKFIKSKIIPECLKHNFKVVFFNNFKTISTSSPENVEDVTSACLNSLRQYYDSNLE